MLRFCPWWVYNNRGLRLAYGEHDSAGSKKSWQWSGFGRWADKPARPELVEGRAVGCSWFDRLTTSVGTDIGAQQTRPLPKSWRTRELGACPPTIGRRAARWLER